MKFVKKAIIPLLHVLANVVFIQPEAAFFKVCVSQLSVVCAAACLVGKDRIIDE